MQFNVTAPLSTGTTSQPANNACNSAGNNERLAIHLAMKSIYLNEVPPLLLDFFLPLRSLLDAWQAPLLPMILLVGLVFHITGCKHQ